MRIHLLVFAGLRETLGRDTVELDLPDGSTAGDAWEALRAAHPALARYSQPPALARNREYVAPSTRLADGDEVALIPPVAGG